jgi:hypothetical protein
MQAGDESHSSIYSILILDAEMQVVVIKVLQRSILSDASCWTPIRKTHLLVLMTMLCILIFSLIKNTETFCDSEEGRRIAFVLFTFQLPWNQC